MTIENPSDLNKLTNAVETAIDNDVSSNPVMREKNRIQQLVQVTVAFAIANKAFVEDRTKLAEGLYDLMPEPPPELRVMQGQCTHLEHQWLEVRAESRLVEEPRWVFIIDVNPLGIHVASDLCSDIVKAAVVVWEPWSVWQAAYLGQPVRGAGVIVTPTTP